MFYIKIIDFQTPANVLVFYLNTKITSTTFFGLMTHTTVCKVIFIPQMTSFWAFLCVFHNYWKYLIFVSRQYHDKWLILLFAHWYLFPKCHHFEHFYVCFIIIESTWFLSVASTTINDSYYCLQSDIYSTNVIILSIFMCVS